MIRNTDSQPIVRMTAREFMMGYESPLTTLGNTLLPHWISFDKVGLIDRVSSLTISLILAISLFLKAKSCISLHILPINHADV